MARHIFAFICFAFLTVETSLGETAKKNETADELSAYKGAPPVLHLTSEQKEILSSGKPVYPPPVEDEKNGGSGIAIFIVDAPLQFVWQVIERFDQYPNWVDGVKKTEMYKPSHGDMVYIKFTVGKWFTPAYEYHIIHNFPKAKTGYGTWSLDTAQKNDLTGCRGFWRVSALKDNPNKSVVEYSVELRTDGFILNLVRPILLSNGVKDATSWVSKQAKIAYENHLAKP